MSNEALNHCPGCGAMLPSPIQATQHRKHCAAYGNLLQALGADKCYRCHGSGKVGDLTDQLVGATNDCPACGGRGKA